MALLLSTALPPAIEAHHEPAPESLHPGAYWYAPRGNRARLMLGEKRAHEYFVRLINGRQYSRCRPGDVFIGPLPCPALPAPLP
jgi:hypothetical protein